MNSKTFNLNYQTSFWESDLFFKDIQYLIIGSGIVGLSAAITLKEMDPKARVLVLDRGMLPIGASTRNAGFACIGSASELLDDLSNGISEDELWTLVEKRYKGLETLKKRVGLEKMDYQHLGGYEIFAEKQEAVFQSCMDQLDDFNKALKTITGYDQTLEVQDESTSKFGFHQVRHLIINKAEGQIHPGKMMAALLEIARQKGIVVLNGASVNQWIQKEDGVSITTNNGVSIQTEKMLLATNGFSNDLLSDQLVKPARNQVMITKPIPNLKIKGCFHYEEGYFYFRNVGNRLLLGGGRHLAKKEETTTQFGTTTLIKNALLDLTKEIILPNTHFEVEQWWSGILGVGSIKSPIVQPISNSIVTAVRLGGMGIAIGSLVGEEGARLLAEL
ncbi:MAG: FAD-dependent oxidoreductase [Bacteroidota bacterium]